jgi:hypothetical protein
VGATPLYGVEALMRRQRDGRRRVPRSQSLPAVVGCTWERTCPRKLGFAVIVTDGQRIAGSNPASEIREFAAIPPQCRGRLRVKRDSSNLAAPCTFAQNSQFTCPNLAENAWLLEETGKNLAICMTNSLTDATHL